MCFRGTAEVVGNHSLMTLQNTYLEREPNRRYQRDQRENAGGRLSNVTQSVPNEYRQGHGQVDRHQQVDEQLLLLHLTQLKESMRA